MKKQKGKKHPQRSRARSKSTTKIINNTSINARTHSEETTNSQRRVPARDESNDDGDATFRMSLLNHGYIVKEMNADGNCLFRSLAHQLAFYQHDFQVAESINTKSSMHVIVRQHVCNYLLLHKDEFQHFLLLDDDDEDVFNVDQYVDKMRKDGQWGGNVEIVAAARVYNRNIKVFSSEYSDGVLLIECDAHEHKGDRLEELLLAYHGNDHYNSIIRLQKTEPTTCSLSNKVEKKKNDHLSNNLVKHEQDCVKKSPPNSDITECGSTKNNCMTRPPARGSNCPCGSGKKYKKCCMIHEKTKKRKNRATSKAIHETEEGGSVAHHEKEKDADNDYLGKFRVISI